MRFERAAGVLLQRGALGTVDLLAEVVESHHHPRNVARGVAVRRTDAARDC